MKKINKFEKKKRQAIEINPIIDEKLFNFLFPVVKVSELDINNEIFNYSSQSISTMLLKIQVMNSLLYDIPDFRAQRFELQVNEKGKIIYNPGKIGKLLTPYSWEREARKIVCAKGSRLGTNIERYAFYGVVIK